MTVWLDFETRSYSDLKQVGTWVYAEHPSTEVICLCYAIDHEPVQVWLPPKMRTAGLDYTPGRCLANGMPVDLHVAITSGHHVEAHNVSFEYPIWKTLMVGQFGWTPILDHQWRDSMAVACYYALPAALDKVSKVLGFPGKDKDGARLITRYSKLHLKTAKPDIPLDDLRKFIAYCKQDVLIEQAISDELGPLPDREIPCWKADLAMNVRGLFLDEASILDASAVADQRAEELTAEFRALTGGINPTQGKRLLVWFAEQGLALDNLQADYLEDLLEEGDIPAGNARRALQVRLLINKASTKKLDAMLRQRGADGRARFQERYHGASTGRGTGSGFGPLNLNRGYDEDKKLTPEMICRDLSYRNPRYLDVLYGDAMDVVAKSSRHHIRAEPGNKIMAGDFVSIEAVILACIAGEQWKIDAFRNGVKLYELMADKIYGLPPGTVTKHTHPMERQDGKTGELAFGYGGALNAWLKFDSSGRHTDERILEINRAWRAEHPMIAGKDGLWKGLEGAAFQAMRFPGEWGYRDIGFERIDDWLAMILPDGKLIWYRDAKLGLGMPPWHKPMTDPECKDGSCGHKPQPYIGYKAQKAGQWRHVRTYGGKLTENACQAISRQYLEPAKQRLGRWMPHGLQSMILSVYDELVTEVPKSFGSEAAFAEILTECPGAWAEGWPIRVETWEGDRYRK